MAMVRIDATPVPLTAVRFKLGAENAAAQPDPLGRTRVGYAPDLPASELWERGRGVWKAKLATVAECDLVILTHDGVVVLVGTVDGVTFHDEKMAVAGRPDPEHPLIGTPDPLHNASRNPVAYGEVLTTPPTATQRPVQSVLTDAIDILTEAARLRRPVYRQTDAGKWEVDPERTEQSDWAEFVTLALAGAAANIGGISDVLAGRPGSWEAAGVESLLGSTVGPDEGDLWQHRTEPLRIHVGGQAVREEFTDDAPSTWDLEDKIDAEQDAELDALDPIDWDALCWKYTIPENGDPVPESSDAPAWSWERYQADRVKEGLPAIGIERLQQRYHDREWPYELGSAFIALAKDAAAEATIAAYEAKQEAIGRKYDDLRDRAEAQLLQDQTAYAETLRIALEHEIARLDGLAVPIDIMIDAVGEEDIPYAPYSLEWNLLERAATFLGEASQR